MVINGALLTDWNFHGINLFTLSQISEIYAHPEYDRDTISNDIALLKLPQRVSFSRYISPACLPQRGTVPPARSKCVVAGWGKENENHFFGSDVLKFARVSYELGEKVTKVARPSLVVLTLRFYSNVMSECYKIPSSLYQFSLGNLRPLSVDIII